MPWWRTVYVKTGKSSDILWKLEERQLERIKDIRRIHGHNYTPHPSLGKLFCLVGILKGLEVEEVPWVPQVPNHPTKGYLTSIHDPQNLHIYWYIYITLATICIPTILTPRPFLLS